MKSFKIQIIGSLLLLAWLLGEQARFWPVSVLERLELISYDQRVEHSVSGGADPGIVIVDIDEYSLQELGQWPWPRQHVAALVAELFESYQIQLLGFDMTFAEPEHNLLASQWQALRSAYPQLPQQPDLVTGDDMLAYALAEYPVVTSFYFEQRRSELPSTGALPRPLVLTDEVNTAALPVPQPTRYTGNIEMLQNQAVGGGFFDNPVVDADGVFRRVPLLQNWQGELYPTLSLAMLQVLLGQPAVTLDVHDAGGVLQLEELNVMGYRLPLDERGNALVPWYGPAGTFSYVSALDVLTGEADPALLQDALVLLGTSAPGLMDLRSTPMGAVFPGVEIHASLLAGMLAQELKAEPGYSQAASLLFLLVVGLMLSWLYPGLLAIKMISITLVLAVLHVSLNLYAWQQGWVWPFAAGLLLLVLLTGWHLIFNFWRESAEKNRVASQFGRYVPPELVNDIVASPKAQDMAGVKARLTVLFSDIRGFTRFAEGLDPTELTSVMNRLLTPVTAAIHEHRGTIDKYMGDAVMAFWGAPLPDDNHAENAIRAALAMQASLAVLNHEFKQEQKAALAMGIGIHSGEMSVGNMGSQFRMAYTVMGDNVNLGSRLEGLTRFYGVDIITSEETLESLRNRDDFVVRRLDRVLVKGREKPVEIFELMGLQKVIPESMRLCARRTDEAIKLYQSGRFVEALYGLEQHEREFPQDKVATIYIERCRRFIEENPGPEWDGVYRHTDK